MPPISSVSPVGTVPANFPSRREVDCSKLIDESDQVDDQRAQRARDQHDDDLDGVGVQECVDGGKVHRVSFFLTPHPLPALATLSPSPEGEGGEGGERGRGQGYIAPSMIESIIDQPKNIQPRMKA